MTASDTVDETQSDFSKEANSWAVSWHSTFFTLYIVVMIISLVIYMCLIRAVAKHAKETPLYLFMLFVFFSSLVEDAVLMQQFIMLHVETIRTDSLCQFLTLATFGNKVLQPTIIVAMLYYAWTCVEFPRSPVEKRTKQFFPLIVIAILVFEIMVVLWPTLNVKGGAAHQMCYNIDSTFDTERAIGWLYLVFFPYLLPFLLSLPPAIRLGLKLRSQTEIVSPNFLAIVKVSLSVTAAYFFFHFLYFMLMLGREVEASSLERSEWRRILGLHVWYITRPMFALIAYGWNLVTPLAPFIFDEDFAAEFPGALINRRRVADQDELNRNSFAMSDSVQSRRQPNGESDEERGVDRQKSDRNANQSFENPLHFMDVVDANELNQSVI